MRKCSDNAVEHFQIMTVKMLPQFGMPCGMKLRRWRLYAKPLTVWLVKDSTSRKNKNDNFNF